MKERVVEDADPYGGWETDRVPRGILRDNPTPGPGLEERDKAGIEKLPENLYEAIQCMQEDKVICDVLGEHIVSKYVEAKFKEWNDYSTRVSQWELDEYLYKF